MWTQRVRVSPGMGLDQGRLNDGFSWRKYGQKEILNARYPRYIRRTYYDIVQQSIYLIWLIYIQFDFKVVFWITTISNL